MSGSENRRLTRGSTRRQLTDETGEHARARMNTPTPQPARVRDGLSSASESEFATESEGEGAAAAAPRPLQQDTEDEELTAVKDPVTSTSRRHADQDAASEQLAWRLAAREVGIPSDVPQSSADETSQDEEACAPETEYESARSMDEDQETVVDVSTRGAAVIGKPVLLISAEHTEEQVGRAVGAYDALRDAVENNRNTPRLVELPCDVPVRAPAPRDQVSPARLSPRRRPNRREAERAELQEQEELARLERERDEARRETAHRRRKSRHTQAAAPAIVAEEPVVRRQQRAAAAGDQRSTRKPTYHPREVLLPLREPEDGSEVRSQRSEKFFSRERGLRMPLFDGEDWAGFMSQFEACINYYGWTEKTKAIRLYTSITGDARKTLGAVGASNWSYAQLKRHMEVRYGKSKVYAQIQAELLQRVRQPGQTLHTYHDELVAASRTANIPEHQREDLVHTAFVFGLRSNQHMHRWVTRHEKEATLEAALAAAEDYEDEYGSDIVFQSMPVSVNARDSTGNALAVALIGHEHNDSNNETVGVNAVEVGTTEDAMQKMMSKELKKVTSNFTSRFDKLDNRLQGVEKWQADQIQYFKDRAAKFRKERDNNRARKWNNNKNNDQSNNNNDSSPGGQQQQNNNSGNYNNNKKQKVASSEVNSRNAQVDCSDDRE